jgi:acyl carrier protein
MAELGEYANIPETDITPAMRLDGPIGMDSLDIVELLMWLEDALDISFSPEDDASIKTVGDLLNAVDRHTGGAP